MFSSRNLLKLLIAIYFCFVNFTNATTINCSATFASEENTLEIKFHRDRVKVYRWNNTKGVNVLVPNVEVSFSGDSFNYTDEFSVFPLRSSIDGTAYVNDDNVLGSCKLEMKLVPNYMHANESVQTELFDMAKSCIDQNICNEVFNITEDDISRARDPYDFGEKTIPYLELNKTYPNIHMPQFRALQDQLSLHNVLQTSLNGLVDFALTGLITAVTNQELGYVILPDLNQELEAKWPAKAGFFNLTGGKIGDLTRAKRSEDVVVSSEGLRYSINTAAELPGAKVVFGKYALLYSIFNREGSGMIEVDHLSLGMQIIVNYNVNPCTIKVGYIRSNAVGPKITLTGNGFGDKVLADIGAFALKKLTRNILSYLEVLLGKLIEEPLSVADCEKFRPRLG